MNRFFDDHPWVAVLIVRVGPLVLVAVVVICVLAWGAMVDAVRRLSGKEPTRFFAQPFVQQGEGPLIATPGQDPPAPSQPPGAA